MNINDKVICINENTIKKYDYYHRDFIYTVGYYSETPSGTNIIFVSELNSWFRCDYFKVVTEKDIRRMKLDKIEST